MPPVAKPPTQPEPQIKTTPTATPPPPQHPSTTTKPSTPSKSAFSSEPSHLTPPHQKRRSINDIVSPASNQKESLSQPKPQTKNMKTKITMTISQFLARENLPNPQRRKTFAPKQNLKKTTNRRASVFGDHWYSALGLRKTEVLADLFEEHSTRHLATYLKPLPKVFNNMCQHTLIPHCGSHEYVSDNDALLIHHLLNCKRLNLPYVILQHMICAANKDYIKNIVPYGMVLTKIFRHFRVSLASETSLIKISKFSTKNLSHMRKTSSAPTPTPSSCPTSLKRKRSSGRQPITTPISFSSPPPNPKETPEKIPTPERSPPPPERSSEHIPAPSTLFAQTSGISSSTIPSYSQTLHSPTHDFKLSPPPPERSPPPPERSLAHIPTPSTLFAQTSGISSSAIPSYSQTLHSPTHDFSTFLSNPLFSTMSPLFVSPQKTSSSIFGISQFLNFPATDGPSNTSVGPLPSVSSTFASIPSISNMPIPFNIVVATTSQPSTHLHSTPTLAAPSNSDIMAALQIIMARQVQHDHEIALLRSWMANHLAPKLGIPPPPPHSIPPPSHVPHPGKSSSSEGSSPSLAS
uniref:Uncharacterized protein PB18E9.04c-like n=1 Tax=Cicer arietinum TaxID=3827 RepID=A0A1S3DWT0_CICAR|nr:uncharacterized protein PB18E9.04c-like [Cicer arietinum]